MIQKLVKEELKGKSGLYGFISKTTGKLYIGFSVNLSFRFNDHTIGYNYNVLFQRATNKYNLQDLIFIIFEYCESKDLIYQEQKYFNSLKPNYNILKDARSSLGFIHSDKTKVLLSKINKDKIVSDETKVLMRDTKIENLNHMFGVIYYHSAETKTKISVIKEGGIICIYDIEGSLVNTFYFLIITTKIFNCSYITIIRYLKSKKLFQDKWFLSISLIIKYL